MREIVAGIGPGEARVGALCINRDLIIPLNTPPTTNGMYFKCMYNLVILANMDTCNCCCCGGDP